MSHVLLIAESDAYLKWAAWTAAALPPNWSVRLVRIRSTSSPSPRQVADALIGTRWTAADVAIIGAWTLPSVIRREKPDVAIVACAGPTAAAVAAIVNVTRPSAVIATGIPGIAVPVRGRAIDARRRTDVFIAHSTREREEYQRAFDRRRCRVRVALSSLPFLAAEPGRSSDGPLVFAAQPSIPARRTERAQLLRLLAKIGPPSPVVKTRVLGSDGRQTHHEPHPYDEIWAHLAKNGEVTGDEVTFRCGPMREVLGEAGALVTVSSTAALEAIDMKIPVTVISDFGVSDVLLNGIFIGSGLLGKIGCHEPALPNEDWMIRNYFHDASQNDLLTQLSRGPAQRRPSPSLGWVTSVARGLVKLAVIGRS